MSRAESQAETRRRILDAAEAELLERPYRDVRIDDVATRAGFTKGAVYSNFGSKAELLVALAERRLDRDGPEYADLTAAGGDGLAADIGARADRTSSENLAWFRIVAQIWAEAVHDPELAERYATVRRAHRARLAAAIESRAASIGIDLPVPAEHLAAGLIGVSMTSFLEQVIDPTVPAADIHATMVDVVLAGVLAKAAPSSD